MLAVLTVVILNGSGTSPAPPPAPGPALFVSPTGRDGNDGTSAATPLATIQTALEKATAGSVITLAPRVYHEEPATVRDGAPGAPIVIKGPETGTDRPSRYQAGVFGGGRAAAVEGARGPRSDIKGRERGAHGPSRHQAVVFGTGRGFNIDHSWITLQGFTTDGQEQLAATPYPADLAGIDAFKQSVQDR